MPGNFASLGYVGWVRFAGMPAGQTSWVRAFSADIKATQTSDRPDVVDGKTDKTVYQLKPIEVGGGVSFPAIHELTAGASDPPAKLMWKLALQRNAELDGGGLVNPEGGDLGQFNTEVKYTSGVGFKYVGCIVNSYEFSIAKEENLTINLDIFGINRTTLDQSVIIQSPPYALRNTRVVGWNDVRVLARHPSGNYEVSSGQFRNFSAKVSNNTNRYYTLNGRLFPAAVLPTKRDINGSFTLMGRNSSLANYVYSATGNTPLGVTINNGNQLRCTEPGEIWFGYSLASYAAQGQYDSNCSGQFFVKLPGCLFEIEELKITNDLFETTVNWHSLPGIEYMPNNEGRNTTFIWDSNWPVAWPPTW